MPAGQGRQQAPAAKHQGQPAARSPACPAGACAGPAGCVAGAGGQRLHIRWTGLQGGRWAVRWSECSFLLAAASVGRCWVGPEPACRPCTLHRPANKEDVQCAQGSRKLSSLHEPSGLLNSLKVAFAAKASHPSPGLQEVVLSMAAELDTENLQKAQHHKDKKQARRVFCMPCTQFSPVPSTFQDAQVTLMAVAPGGCCSCGQFGREVLAMRCKSQHCHGQLQLSCRLLLWARGHMAMPAKTLPSGGQGCHRRLQQPRLLAGVQSQMVWLSQPARQAGSRGGHETWHNLIRDLLPVLLSYSM